VQEHFGVAPDLAVFAKGIANGMPLSVYCGKAEVMDKLDRAIVSSTYGGEALSLAAAKACIETYRSEPVIEHIWRQSERVWSGLDGLLQERGVPARVQGLWPCPAITFGPDAPEGLEDRFYRAAYAHGVSLYHVSYVTYSHQDSDIDETLERLQKAVKEL
jgi:glutamate-1-semialdehyde 2,1-aminomutase